MLDTYYSWNLNSPASRINGYRLFDHRANAGDISYGELAIETPVEPIGFRVDVGFGRTTYFVHGSEAAGRALRYVQQAYVSARPFKNRKVQVDFGKFVTSAGAEVIEAPLNWNYSRSLLFCWAVPFYHFGLRTTVPLHADYTAGVQIVQGWNNVRDQNGAKTVGLTGAWTRGNVSWFHNYYVGREKADVDKAAQPGVRQLFDSTVVVTTGSRLAMYVNGVIGSDRRVGGGADRWYGLAGAGRAQITDRWAAASRLEWFKDRDGFATGTPQRLTEVTFTCEYALPAGKGQRAIWRIEYRRDWSTAASFERAAGEPLRRHQDTVLLGMLFVFSRGM